MMMSASSGLSEVVCLKVCENESDDIYFNRDKTLALINLFKIYKPKVARGEIKSMKKMWEIIAREISNKFKITILASKCENRFKVLERNYKKTVDANNKSGRGRKDFEFEREFCEIYGKKHNITPKILLSSEEIIEPRTRNADNVDVVEPGKAEKVKLSLIDKPSTSSHSQAVSAQPSLLGEDENLGVMLNIPDEEPSTKKVPQKRKKRPSAAYKKRNEILIDIKNDLKNYYEEKLKIEKEKLQLKKDNLKDRIKRTNLLEE